ncbi:MAG: sigma-54 dependent transcriptional regulator [Desulfobulbaceae bacterium]|nr:sigma-54 dependent transcriptional regulator [Desulfobulbaceae bacterium]
MKNILLVDDEANMRHMLRALLSRRGYQVEEAASGEAALTLVAERVFDAILCDVKMPGVGGLEFLRRAKEQLAATTVIMMSAYGNIELAVEAMREGAYDFIAKPFQPDEIILTLKKAEERENLRRENQRLRDELLQAMDGKNATFSSLIGASESMRKLVALAEKIAPYNAAVLITGESGTGKELIAQGIHAASPRRDKAIVSVNCASIPEHLLESEFFGHRKGAFTGADRDRKGLFEEAMGGSLFLDEIAELPLNLQGKLLRVLQENEVRPLGSTRTRKVDARIIAATSKNLVQMRDQGLFREDLFYRLNVMGINVPPLRDRKEDIPMLCAFFLQKFNRLFTTDVESISPEAMRRLQAYDWPGNVRELENVIQRGMVLAEGHALEHVAVPERRIARQNDDDSENLSLKEARKKLEARLIARALARVKGNRSKAAILLEISYPSLLEKIKSHRIEVPENPGD